MSKSTTSAMLSLEYLQSLGIKWVSVDNVTPADIARIVKDNPSLFIKVEEKP